MTFLTQDPLNSQSCLAQLELMSPAAGALISFTGKVRPIASNGQVKTLHLQAYSPMTENGISAAVDQATTRWPLDGVLVRHRIGDMAAGDTIVFVGTASTHRRAAFEAADFLMDYLKTEAIFWKKEVTEHGAQWIEPRPEDYSDRSRWQ